MISKVIFLVTTYIIGVIWGANALINKALADSVVFVGRAVSYCDMFCMLKCASRSAHLF